MSDQIRATKRLDGKSGTGAARHRPLLSAHSNRARLAARPRVFFDLASFQSDAQRCYYAGLIGQGHEVKQWTWFWAMPPLPLLRCPHLL